MTTTSLSQLQKRDVTPVKTGFFDSESFELMQRVAKGFASSSLVPQIYQNNIANCMIALNMSQRIGADPLMVMQNLVPVYGRPSWSSQFLIATVNTCGRFSTLRYSFFGVEGTDEWGCQAWAVEKETGERLLGSKITIAIAKKEGWYARNGSKWQTIPQQMLMYRAAAWWQRAYAPELAMGLKTTEEEVDVIDVTPDGSVIVTTETLRDTPLAAAENISQKTENIKKQEPIKQNQEKQTAETVEIIETTNFVLVEEEQKQEHQDQIIDSQANFE